MGTLKEFQCNGCGYTVTGTRKGCTLGMMGVIETEKVPSKCPKKIRGTDSVPLIEKDYIYDTNLVYILREHQQE